MSFNSDFCPEFSAGEAMNYTGELRNPEAFQILVSDDFTGRNHGYAHGPERSLMMAMLFDAVQGYICYSQLPQKKRARSIYREAFNWVHDNSRDYVFSFNNVCEALGINPPYLRLGLLNIANSGKEHKRARRKF